jgi:hypothetical protein
MKDQYFSIRKGLYTDRKYRKISLAAKGLYMALRTCCPEMNVLGVYIKDKISMCELFGEAERKDVKKCLEEIDRLLTELQTAGLVVYNERLVVIVNYLYEFPINPSSNTAIHAARKLATVFELCPENAVDLLDPIAEIVYNCVVDCSDQLLSNTVFEDETLSKPFLHFGLDDE